MLTKLLPQVVHRLTEVDLHIIQLLSTGTTRWVAAHFELAAKVQHV